MEVRRDGPAGGGAFRGVVAEHAGQFRVAVRSLLEPRSRIHRHSGEQALQEGVAPGVRVEVRRGVGADGRGDQPRVVGAQGVLDEGHRRRRGRLQMGQREQDGAAFRGRALPVQAGQGGGVRTGLPQQQHPGAVGVLLAAVPAGGGEVPFPGGQAGGCGGAVVARGSAVGGSCFGEGRVEPVAGGVAESAVQDLARGCRHAVAPFVGVWERRKWREVRASSGPAWEWRGSSTTVRPW